MLITKQSTRCSTVAELIATLSKLDGETPILVETDSPLLLTVLSDKETGEIIASCDSDSDA